MDYDVYKRKVPADAPGYFLCSSSPTLFDGDLEVDITLLDYSANGWHSADYDRSITPENCCEYTTDYSFQDNDSDIDESVEEEEIGHIGGTRKRKISTPDHDSDSYKEEANDTIVRPPLVAGKKSAARALGRVRRLGKTRLEWFDPAQKLWRPAVYHTDIRHQLIEDAARLGSYRFDWYQGKTATDITAFHPAYANNGEEREDWPKILFQYLPKVSDFSHCKPGLWQTHDGRVIIDVNNDAMLDYPEIPVTLSWKAPAWLLVTINRLNNCITMQDFRGRMAGPRKPTQADPLGRNRISMNMTRWRKQAGCLSWKSIREADSFRDYLDRKLPAECIRLNSTETFRNLHAWEMAESMLIDAGKFLERSRAKKKVKTAAKSKEILMKEIKNVKYLKEVFDAEFDGPDSDNDDLMADKGIDLVNLRAINGTEAACEDHREGTLTDSKKPVEKNAKRQKVEPRNFERRVLQDTLDSLGTQEIRVMCPRHHLSNGFLTKAPSSVKEAQLLYELLEPSRFHYDQCTYRTAPETFGDECYRCQHADLQDAMNEFQRMHRKIRNQVPIKLFGLQYVDDKLFHWSGGWVENWFGPRLRMMGGRKHNDGERVWG
ncbi:MAG: hypothetical protein Q9220_002249 [cf. Caloplaca sp. 1 TL-2023]